MLELHAVANEQPQLSQYSIYLELEFEDALQSDMPDEEKSEWITFLATQIEIVYFLDEITTQSITNNSTGRVEECGLDSEDALGIAIGAWGGGLAGGVVGGLGGTVTGALGGFLAGAVKGAVGAGVATLVSEGIQCLAGL